MNADEAADVRDQINDLDVVDGAEVAPDEETNVDAVFRYARVNQPGYQNGDPFFEVLLTPSTNNSSGSIHLPRELLDWLGDSEYYVRVDREERGEVHIRDQF